MALVNVGNGDQSDGSGLIGRRVAVDLCGKMREGRVMSLAGMTRAGLPIYMVQLDRRSRAEPFVRDSMELVVQGEWTVGAVDD